MRSEDTRCWNDRTWKQSVTDRSGGSCIRFRGERPGKRLFNLSGWQPQKAPLHRIDDRQVIDACDQDGKY